MALSNQDQQIVRQYLLGQLTEDEQQKTEERLLTEDQWFEELEIAKDELVEEYLAEQLTQEEQKWFEQHFLASPEGKQRRGFARALNRYVLNHALPQKKLNFGERFSAFWNSQPSLLKATTAVAVLVIVAGVFWISRAPAPQSFATLTLTNTISTRSLGTESAKVQLKDQGLRITLMLPSPAAPGDRYRVELANDKGETKTSEVVAQNAQSVTVEIPAAQLTPGQYAVKLSTLSAEGAAQRIPGSYYFTVE